MQHCRGKSTWTTLRYPGPLGTHCKLHWFLAVWTLRKVSYHPTMSRNLLKSTTTHPHYTTTTFSNWWFPKNADGKSASDPHQTAPSREFLLQLSPSPHTTGYVRKTMIPSLQNSIKASGMIFSKPQTQPYWKQWTTHKGQFCTRKPINLNGQGVTW